MVVKSRKQEPEAVEHVEPAVQKHSKMKVGTQLVFSTAQGMAPPTFRVVLPNSINLIKSILPRHAQRLP